MKRALAALIFFLAAGSAASATATLTCTAGKDATVYIQIGSVAISSIIGVDIEIGDSLLSTISGRGEQIALLQSYVEADKILIDLSDTNLERIVAQIRLFIANEGETLVTAGTLDIDGVGAFALVCDEF